MLFIRSLRLDRLSYSIKQFISTNLGSQFSETPIKNFKNILDDFNNKNAVIFILSPGTDPVNIVTNMATNCNKKENFQILSMGEGLELTAIK